MESQSWLRLAVALQGTPFSGLHRWIVDDGISKFAIADASFERPIKVWIDGKYQDISVYFDKPTELEIARTRQIEQESLRINVLMRNACKHAKGIGLLKTLAVYVDDHSSNQSQPEWLTYYTRKETADSNLHTIEVVQERDFCCMY